VKVIGNLTKDAIIRAAVSEGISVTQEIGSSVTFESATTSYTSVVYDSSNQKIVIAYRDQGNSNYGTAIVGTVSGSSISFGTPTVFESATVAYISGAYDSNNNKVVFSFKGTSDYGRSVVGTVSGTSISFGSVTNFESAAIESTGTAYDANAQKIVVAYRDDGNSNYGTAAVGTVSGTSISFGTPVVFQASASYYFTPVYDANAQKVVIGYRDDAASSAGTAIVGTVSGTSISFGTKQAFESGNTTHISGVYDSTNQKVVFAYSDGGNSSHGTAVVGTVSGTSISFGTPVVFNAGNSGYFSASFDSNAGRVLISYSDDSNSSKGEAVVGTVSGTSISFSDSVLFKDASADFVASAYDANQGRVVIAYRSPGNSNYGEAVVFKVGYSQATGGTIADGKPVVVNANGTVSSVGQSTISEAVGSVAVFETSNTGEADAVYDSSNQKVVVTYRDAGDSNKGTAVVGTVDASNNSITFGTPVVFTSKNIEYSSCTYDSVNNKVVVAYANASSPRYGHAIVGTVSGTSISFGSEATFNTYEVQFVSCGFDASAGKVVIVYEDWGNNNYGMAIIGTVSGTSITFGTEVTYESARTQNPSVVYDSNAEKTVICFSTYADSEHGYGIVGTVSGTSISFGSKTEFENATVNNVSTAYDASAQKIVVAYRDYGNSYYGTAVVGTVSGTSISFGTPVVFESANVGTKNISVVYDSNVNKIVIAHTYNKKVISGTVSGTSITFDTAIVYDSGATSTAGAAYDANAKKVVIAYADGDNSSYGTGIVYQPSGSATTLTTENFVGFMDGAALDGTNGEILSSCSIARNQTSLTPGQTYFVSPTDGALSLTAGSPSVTAETAISSTELIVKG